MLFLSVLINFIRIIQRLFHHSFKSILTYLFMLLFLFYRISIINSIVSQFLWFFKIREFNFQIPSSMIIIIPIFVCIFVEDYKNILSNLERIINFISISHFLIFQNFIQFSNSINPSNFYDYNNSYYNNTFVCIFVENYKNTLIFQNFIQFLNSVNLSSMIIIPTFAHIFVEDYENTLLNLELIPSNLNFSNFSKFENSIFNFHPLWL